MPMSMPALMAWNRNTECIASRTVSLPRKEKEKLETPPEIWACGSSAADARRRLDEGLAIFVMLLQAGGDREDVGIEDDVFRRKADLVHQDVVGALADLDLALARVGLALLRRTPSPPRRRRSGALRGRAR